MGDPRRISKKYSTPAKLWSQKRIDEEKELMERYGLAQHREIWKAKALLRTKRQIARGLLGLQVEQRGQREHELMESLQRVGLLQKNAILDDVLGLTVNALLERRLQSIVWRKGLSLTAKQARQFIVHGHIAIQGKRMNVPGYIVPSQEEETIKFYKEPIPLNVAVKKETAKKAFQEVEKAIKEIPTEEVTTPVSESEVVAEMEIEAREEIAE